MEIDLTDHVLYVKESMNTLGGIRAFDSNGSFYISPKRIKGAILR